MTWCVLLSARTIVSHCNSPLTSYSGRTATLGDDNTFYGPCFLLKHTRKGQRGTKSAVVGWKRYLAQGICIYVIFLDDAASTTAASHSAPWKTIDVSAQVTYCHHSITYPSWLKEIIVNHSSEPPQPTVTCLLTSVLRSPTITASQQLKATLLHDGQHTHSSISYSLLTTILAPW